VKVLHLHYVMVCNRFCFKLTFTAACALDSLMDGSEDSFIADAEASDENEEEDDN
jgi:hypothetical protein